MIKSKLAGHLARIVEMAGKPEGKRPLGKLGIIQNIPFKTPNTVLTTTIFLSFGDITITRQASCFCQE
jgi:hypothetical protein